MGASCPGMGGPRWRLSLTSWNPGAKRRGPVSKLVTLGPQFPHLSNRNEEHFTASTQARVCCVRGALPQAHRSCPAACSQSGGAVRWGRPSANKWET